MAYVDISEFRIQATQASSVPQVLVESLIEQASRYFDSLCGVTEGYFELAGTSATARTFYGDGTNYLRLDPYVSGSLNASITLPDGYTVPEFIEGGGYLIIVSSGIRYSLTPWWASGGWLEGVPVVVTARWGFAATPADVKLAIIELAINLWRTVDPAETNLTDLEGQPLRERVPPRVAEIARLYRTQESMLV